MLDCLYGTENNKHHKKRINRNGNGAGPGLSYVTRPEDGGADCICRSKPVYFYGMGSAAGNDPIRHADRRVLV
jgi:hypothetical protein